MLHIGPSIWLGALWPGTRTTGGPLLEDFTFTRASTKSARTIDGHITEFASGEPALTDMGYSIHKAVANTVANPRDFSDTNVWRWTGIASVAKNQIGVDGLANSATLVTEDTGNSTHQLGTDEVARSTSQTWTVYAIVKYGGGNPAQFLQWTYSSATHGATQKCNYDILNGIIGGLAGTGASASINPLWNGWMIIRFTSPTTAAATNSAFLNIVSGLTAARGETTVGTSKTYLIWGVSDVLDTLLTNFVSGTSAADVMTLAKVPPSDDFALFFEGYYLDALQALDSCYVSWSDGTNQNYLALNAGSTSQLIVRTVDSGAAAQTRLNEGDDPDADSFIPRPKYVKAALRRVGADTWTLFINGTKRLSDATFTIPAGLTTLHAGHLPGPTSFGNNFVKDVRVLGGDLSDDALITYTSAPAYTPADVVLPAAADFTLTTRAFQGLPACQSTGTRIWVGWYGDYVVQHSSGESPGNYLVLATSDDDMATAATERAYYRAGNGFIDQATDPKFLYDSTVEDTLFVFYRQTGCGMLADGQYGVFLGTVSTPNGTPTFNAPTRLLDGVTGKPFKAGGQWYVPVDIWGISVWAAKPGRLQVGKHIYRFDFTTRSLVYHSTLPTGTHSTFDETTVVELANGHWLAHWRTTNGGQKAVWNGTAWGSASQITSHVTAASRQILFKLPSGRIGWLYNESDPGSTREDITLTLAEDDNGDDPFGGTLDTLLLDTRTGTSYPDGCGHASGKIAVAWDRDRTTNKEVLGCVLTESEVVAGTAVVTIRTVSDK